MAGNAKSAQYKLDILVGDGRKTTKHIKIRKAAKSQAEAAADRWISEYADLVVTRHEWAGSRQQIWYLEPA